MFDRRLATTLIAMGLSAVVAVVAALLPPPEAALPPVETPEAVQQMTRTVPVIREPEPEEAPMWLYVIKEHDGRVAVFGRDLSEPVTVLEQRVRYLPEYDRIELAAGIEIFSEFELAARIEDYTS